MALLLSDMEIVTPGKINFKWHFHPFSENKSNHKIIG